ncbi:MAG: hypothetical protein K2J10_03620 [Muribaculaceae bacterium]|nr:hypothetical protein [Muribaculaceae bacterium]
MTEIVKPRVTTVHPCASQWGSVGCRDGDCYADGLEAIAVSSLKPSSNNQTDYCNTLWKQL